VLSRNNAGGWFGKGDEQQPGPEARPRVAGGAEHEVACEAMKVGNSRKKVERALKK
jgi:hypothetical protein